MATFDLTAVTTLQERERLRLGRWLTGGFAVLIAISLLWKVLSQHSSPGYRATILAGVLGDALLWWFFLYLFASGPISVEVSPGVIQFHYRSRRTQIFRTRADGFRMKLALTLPPADLSRRDIIPEPPYFAINYLRWLPLTPDAYRAIVSELEGTGLVPVVTSRPNPPAGGWRFFTYHRPRS